MRHRGGDGADRAGVAHPGTPRLPDVSTASPAVEIDGLVMRYGDKVVPLKLKAGESYTYACTFPGHSSIMRGTLTLK